MRTHSVLAVVAGLCVLPLAACSQGSSTSSSTTTAKDNASASVGEAKGKAPAPFDAGEVKIAIVQQSGQGDYFQQYLNGTCLLYTSRCV